LRVEKIIKYKFIKCEFFTDLTPLRFKIYLLHWGVLGCSNVLGGIGEAFQNPTLKGCLHANQGARQSFCGPHTQTHSSISIQNTTSWGLSWPRYIHSRTQTGALRARGARSGHSHRPTSLHHQFLSFPPSFLTHFPLQFSPNSGTLLLESLPTVFSGKTESNK